MYVQTREYLLLRMEGKERVDFLFWNKDIRTMVEKFSDMYVNKAPSNEDKMTDVIHPKDPQISFRIDTEIIKECLKLLLKSIAIVSPEYSLIDQCKPEHIADINKLICYLGLFLNEKAIDHKKIYERKKLEILAKGLANAIIKVNERNEEK